MSHTILKPASHRANRSNTLLNEVAGTLEIYWEQFKNFARTKRQPIATEDLDSEFQDYAMKKDDHSIHTKKKKDNRTKFLDANVVFG